MHNAVFIHSASIEIIVFRRRFEQLHNGYTQMGDLYTEFESSNNGACGWLLDVAQDNNFVSVAINTKSEETLSLPPRNNRAPTCILCCFCLLHFCNVTQQRGICSTTSVRLQGAETHLPSNCSIILLLLCRGTLSIPCKISRLECCSQPLLHYRH
jgi:hypothetical protein